jgi:F-type H+-transporting ATPase subunit b
MDLFNQTLNSFSIHLSEGGVSLNLDIFEANLINIVILAGGLFYLLSDALSKSLSERQKNILDAIQESEEKLQEATIRLTEAETNLAQAQIVIKSIEKDACQTLEQIKAALISEGNEEIDRIVSNTKNQIMTMDKRLSPKLVVFFATLTIQRFKGRIDGKLSPKVAQAIIDKNILNLVQ